MQNEIILSFKNWEKFNTRKDIVAPRWFAFQNSFFEDPKFFYFSNDEKIVFLYLLCEASKSSNKVIHILNHERTPLKYKTANVSAKIFEETIEKLQRYKILDVRYQDGTYAKRTDDERETNAKRKTQYNTIQDNTEYNLVQKQVLNVTQKFDLESVYDAYPRKQGKTKGLQKLKTQIKNSEQFDLLKKSISNYKSFLVRKKTEPQFIKIFSTFCNEWEDWVDERSGEINLVQKQESLLQKELREEREAKQISLVSVK